VAVNCASLPESLIESELFGYKSGAFTGASREGRRGKILQANGGTLFLDEIGDMPLPLQARLLRVLEEREVSPLGSEVSVKVDFRLISATHQGLEELIDKGQFRHDLYYRLQGISISLPALRERTDKRNLIRQILASESVEGKATEIDEGALQLMEHYHWPGNIRQLRNALRTALALREGPSITVMELPEEITRASNYAGNYASNYDGLLLREERKPGNGAALNSLESAEKNALLVGLEKHRWKITNLAKELNVSRNTLYRKMKRLDIKDPNK
jgi:transcriptional regulator of acetoin/glycerol metabolism